MKTSSKFAVFILSNNPKLFERIFEKLNSLKFRYDLYVIGSFEIYDDLRRQIDESGVQGKLIGESCLDFDSMLFSELCRTEQLYQYEAVLKLRAVSYADDKKTEMDEILCDSLCESRYLVEAILNKFLNSAGVGLVGPAASLRSANATMRGASNQVDKILHAYICSSVQDWEYFDGGIFWISGKILTLLGRESELPPSLVESGGNQIVSKNISHAWELAFGAFASFHEAIYLVVDRLDTFGPFCLFDQFSHPAEQSRQSLECDDDFFLERWSNTKKWIEIVNRSDLFDSKYYGYMVRDLLPEGMNPAYHYMIYGDFLNIDPSPDFSTSFYLISNPAVEKDGMCSLVHYLTVGQINGRVASPVDADWWALAKKLGFFDGNWYKSVNLDVLAGMDSEAHYLTTGVELLRAGSKNFDPSSIPIMTGISKAPWKHFLKNHFLIETRLYQRMLSAYGYEDHALVNSYVRQILGTYGNSLALEQLIAVNMTKSKNWGDALKNWEDYYYSDKQIRKNRRHGASIVSHNEKTSSGNGLFSIVPMPNSNQVSDISNFRICVYTTLFGDCDDLLPILYPIKGVDFVCFTDQRRLEGGWKQILVDPDLGSSNRNAKTFKIMPHKYLAEYQASLFVDANTLFLGRLNRLLEYCVLGGDFVMWQHPERKNLYTEACAIIQSKRHSPKSIIEQIKHYSDLGMPRNTGLCEASFIWRRHNNPELIAFMEEWWREIETFSHRDQLSLCYLMWKKNIKPKILCEKLGTSRNNLFFVKIPHKSDSDQKPVRSHFGVRTVKKRDVVFIYDPLYEHTGSTVLRSKQLSGLAGASEKISRSIEYSSSLDQKGKILILSKGLLKNLELQRIRDLSVSNILIADFVDEPPVEAITEVVDALMASSLCSYKDYLRQFPAKQIFHVTHHVDTRIAKDFLLKPRVFSAAYFGELVNTIESDAVSKYVKFVSVNTKKQSLDWMDELPDHNLHYAVRKKRKIDGHKPFLKGFVAAQCGANIMIQKNSGDSLFYLGDDYPFLLSENPDETEIVSTLEKTSFLYGGPEWRYGLEIMRDVREKSSVEYVCGELSRMIDSF